MQLYLQLMDQLEEILRRQVYRHLDRSWNHFGGDLLGILREQLMYKAFENA